MNASQALVPFGFTQLEAQIYGFLLSEAPATGYRIAQGIGKPVANVYKAIESLAEKQALLVESTKNRECRPIAPDALMARLQSEFDARKKAAESAFSKARTKGERDPLYPVRGKDDLVAKAIEACDAATKSVLASGSKSLLALIDNHLRAAVARGVSVGIRSDASLGIEGATVYGPTGDDDLAGRWPGDLLLLVADGERFVLGLVDRWGNVVQGLSGKSRLFAVVLHQGLAADLCLAELAERIEEGAGAKRLNRTIAGMRRANDTPGFAALCDELI